MYASSVCVNVSGRNTRTFVDCSHSHVDSRVQFDRTTVEFIFVDELETWRCKGLCIVL